MQKKVEKKRCVCYCRKSTDEGLDMEYNSLDAQREACENYIASQKANGWMCLPVHYDDGGYSGGNTNRPALQKLLADCEKGLVDIIVVIKSTASPVPSVILPTFPRNSMNGAFNSFR